MCLTLELNNSINLHKNKIVAKDLYEFERALKAICICKFKCVKYRYFKTLRYHNMSKIYKGI